jgi:hypothetical protein
MLSHLFTFVLPVHSINLQDWTHWDQFDVLLYFKMTSLCSNKGDTLSKKECLQKIEYYYADIVNGEFLQNEIIAKGMQIFDHAFLHENLEVPRQYVSNIFKCLNSFDNFHHGGRLSLIDDALHITTSTYTDLWCYCSLPCSPLSPIVQAIQHMDH